MDGTRHIEALAIRPDGVAGRTMRAAVFTVVSLSLAVVAHQAAGGQVGGPVLALSAVAVGVLGWRLARSRRTRSCVGVVVVGTQVLLHAVFMSTQLGTVLAARSSSAVASRRALTTMLFCLHGGHRPAPAQVAASARHIGMRMASPGGGLHVMAMLCMGWPMAIAHVLAAAVVAWWLARGESACWAAAERIARAISDVVPVLRVPVVPRVVVRRETPRILRRAAACISRRGPPLRQLVYPYRFAQAS